MKYIRLKDVTISTQYGYTAEETFKNNGKYKYLRITDIVPYFINFANVPFCSIPENKVEQYLVHEDDILIARTGATTGYNYVVPAGIKDTVYASYLIRFKIDPQKIESRYLKYVLKSNSYYGFVNNHIGGSAQPGMNAKVFGRFNIPAYSLPTQRKIASILSSYDFLIENNTKRIRLLEQMAENLYKEWFVRFRFPGYENTEFVDGLPKGWKYEKFGDYVEVKRGGSPRPIQDYLSETGLNWLKISDVTSLNSPFVFDIKERILESGLNKTVFRKAGTLVLSNSATPGISKILCVDTCIHDGWLYFENSYFSNEYMNLFFQQERTNILKLGNGAVFTNLKTDILKNYKAYIPPKNILEKFQTLITSYYEQIKALEKQKLNLTRQRDLLLPRLMSGKLEVKS